MKPTSRDLIQPDTRGLYPWEVDPSVVAFRNEPEEPGYDTGPSSLEMLSALGACMMFVIAMCIVAVGLGAADPGAWSPTPVATCTTDLQCEQLTGEPVSLEAVER